MTAVLNLPEWVQITLLLVALATIFGFFYITATAATHYIELHIFKVRVITLRNDQVRRLQALMTGDDPDGSASAMFGEVEIVEEPAQPAQQAA